MMYSNDRIVVNPDGNLNEYKWALVNTKHYFGVYLIKHMWSSGKIQLEDKQKDGIMFITLTYNDNIMLLEPKP